MVWIAVSVHTVGGLGGQWLHSSWHAEAGEGVGGIYLMLTFLQVFLLPPSAIKSQSTVHCKAGACSGYEVTFARLYHPPTRRLKLNSWIMSNSTPWHMFVIFSAGQKRANKSWGDPVTDFLEATFNRPSNNRRFISLLGTAGGTLIIHSISASQLKRFF